MAQQSRFSAIQLFLFVLLFVSLGSVGRGQNPEADRRARQAELFTETIEARQRRERQAELFSKKPTTANYRGGTTAETNTLKPVDKTGRWTVFVVPGTYGNAGAWFHVQPGKATFGSELQAALGSNAVVHAEPWQSSIHHAVREKAA